MLKTPQVNINDLIRLEQLSVIPLASFRDKLLTISINGTYTVTMNGKNVYAGKSALQATERYNSLFQLVHQKIEKPPIKSKKLYQLING